MPDKTTFAPFSKPLERATLGYLIACPETATEMRPTDYYISAHQGIMQAWSELNGNGLIADVQTLIQHLTETGQLASAGGAFFVTGLVDEADPSEVLFRKSEAKVLELSQRRKLREKVIALADKDFESMTSEEITKAIEGINESFSPDNARDTGINSIMGAPMDFWEMADYEYERPEDFIQGILPLETLLLLYGVQKVGKSLLALNLALHLAAGKPWFHLQISKPHKTLFISAEGGLPMLIDRIQHLKSGEIIPSAENLKIWPIPPIDILSSTDFGGLVAAIETFQPEVIILDPLSKLHIKDENSNNEMAEVLGRLRQLVTNHGRSLILNHHARKSGDAFRGASSIAGEVDAIIRLEWENREEHTGNRRLYFEDLRHAEPPADLYLTLNPKTLSFMGTDSHSIETVMQILTENGGRLNRTMLRNEIIERTGVQRARAYAIIKSAEISGDIRPEGKDLCLKKS